MKKRLIVSFCLLSGLFFCVQAQEIKTTVDNLAAYHAKADSIQGWKKSGLIGITFGQTALSNWAAGGDNTVSGDFFLNLSANYLKNQWFWDNNLSLQYGMISSSAYDYWQKSADKINFASIGGRKFSDKWAFALLLNFNTQFARGYDYGKSKDVYISTFMAPAYLDMALGFTYKPNPKYTIFLSPLAERAIFVLDDSLSNAGALSDPGKKVKWETGAYIKATTNQEILQNLSLISSLDLFTPYNKDFGNVDLNWDLLLNYKLTKLLTATVSTTLRYYDNEIKKVQFKEILGLGLTVNF
ncbi:MAG: DUF3078 domain-containing protein [Candidatus Azobacteroides sp.]|nr:DUF3078 domain-containing protein [Candidatus Azobacteroides sp.]